MASTTTYTVSYSIPNGIPSVSTLKLDLKANNAVLYTTVDTHISPAVGVTFSYTTAPLLSHRIYVARVETVCSGPTIQVGDYQYLMNLICNVATAIAATGPSIDVNWDSYIDETSGDSLKEYILEYKDVLSVGAWYSITITKADILTYWSTNAYPGYMETITTGINPATTYELRLTTVLNYDYITVTGTISTDVVIGPCIINNVIIP